MFSFDPTSEKSSTEQVKDYLRKQNYVNRIDQSIINTEIIAIQCQEVQNAIRDSSQKERVAISESTDAICSSLESGFFDLNNSLHNINDGINGLSNLVGIGFALVAESQKITHQYLGNIQNLLRIPESQKQRVYHIDNGLVYFQRAIRESPEGDFTDALEEFNNAIAIEKKDFFSLYYLGIIYLTPKHYDPRNAEYLLRNSAKYYLDQALYSGSNVANKLLPSNNGFLKEAAQAYLLAAHACYFQKKFAEASELASEAWKNYPPMIKAGLMQSKCLAANNQGIEAAKILEKAIKINPPIYMEVLSDKDLNSKPEIIGLRERLRKEANNEAKNTWKRCNQQLVPNSNAADYLNEIKKLIDENHYLSSVKAINLLNAVRNWEFREPFSNHHQSDYFREIIGIIEIFTSLNYYKSDTTFNIFSPIDSFFSNSFFQKINQQTQWTFPFIISDDNSITWQSQIKSNIYNSNVVEFIDLEQQFDDNLPNVISDLKRTLEGYYNDNTEYLNYLEKKRIEADTDNYKESVRKGLKNGLISLFVGWLICIPIGFILQLGSSIANGGDKGAMNIAGPILIPAIVIAGIVGFIIKFNEVRNK